MSPITTLKHYVNNTTLNIQSHLSLEPFEPNYIEKKRPQTIYANRKHCVALDLDNPPVNICRSKEKREHMLSIIGHMNAHEFDNGGRKGAHVVTHHLDDSTPNELPPSPPQAERCRLLPQLINADSKLWWNDLIRYDNYDLSNVIIRNDWGIVLIGFTDVVVSCNLPIKGYWPFTPVNNDFLHTADGNGPGPFSDQEEAARWLIKTWAHSDNHWHKKRSKSLRRELRLWKEEVETRQQERGNDVEGGSEREDVDVEKIKVKDEDAIGLNVKDGDDAKDGVDVKMRVLRTRVNK
ncbi:hypothetical protein QBC36DRAFT_310724 [Triangularia setosa]|uniref:Uncharacterized protein n=1 Tax=Triangularia setosa TaxID=2587417 RepID=A0AAN6WA15_9PEZI|nr:hypothetical protein QBC36DRAFT_310724 [Podospora setosa]